ncbi:MAG: RusA family crossover junction endodeoxyribonuclease, partial [Vicingaceae bacterium]|nr:RusA family crossover junction endodeoxyribonuclease [Vicingaceae bacterium]
RERTMVENGIRIYKSTKPDLPDNLQKLVCDSLAGIVYTNDSRIVYMEVEKYYGTIPKTMLKFWKIL